MKNHSEDDLQMSCVRWLSLQYPNLLFYHPRNGGSLKGAREGARFKKMGVLAGVPDLCIVKSTWDYHGLYIELKTLDGRQSMAQKDFQARCQAERYRYVICRSIDEFMQVINNYLNLKHMKTTHKIQFFSRKPLFGRRQHHWRAVAANGNVIARSSEGYNNNDECRRSFANFRNALADGTYETEELK